MRRQTTEDRRARGITGGSRTVGVAEQHPARGEAIQVWCYSLRMPAQTTDPVIEIIDRNEKYIGLISRSFGKVAEEGGERQ